jgi:hypothetical protein
VDQVVLDSFHQGCGGGVGDSEEFLHIFPVNCFRVAPPPPVEELVKVGGGSANPSRLTSGTLVGGLSGEPPRGPVHSLKWGAGGGPPPPPGPAFRPMAEDPSPRRGGRPGRGPPQEGRAAERASERAGRASGESARSGASEAGEAAETFFPRRA